MLQQRHQCLFTDSIWKYRTFHKSDLNRHILIHTEQSNQFICEECNRGFYLKSSLNHHKRYKHSDERPFVCSVTDCHKRYKTNYNLNRHKLIHSMKKSFECNECEMRFLHKSHLINHQKIHLNKRPFVCQNIGCSRAFTAKHHLVRHKLIHSNEKPFKCYVNNCHKSFRRRGDLIGHKNRIHYRIKS